MEEEEKSRERERGNKLLDFARQKKIEAKKIERPSASADGDGAERMHPANYLQTGGGDWRRRGARGERNYERGK